MGGTPRRTSPRHGGQALRSSLLFMKLLVRTGLVRFLPGVRRRLGSGAAYLRHWSDRALTAPVEDLSRLAAELSPQADGVIDLSLGAPRFDVLPSASTKLPADSRGWPPACGLSDLRQAVAHKLAQDNRACVDAAGEVLITPGALGAVQIAFDAFVNRGDAVVLFDPSSPLHALVARDCGARLRWVNCWSDDDGRLRFHTNQLATALRGARLLIVTSPANPSGGVLTLGDFEAIAALAERHDVLVLSDESFERYHYQAEPVSIASLPRARPRTLVAGSVSKSHALAWARVGWLAGCRELLIPCTVAAALRAPFVPTLSQQLAAAALRTAPAAFTALRDELSARRRYAYERLRAMDLSPAWPAGGLFLWVPIWKLGLSGRELAAGLLRNASVLVTPGDLFGPSGAGYVRISFAADAARLQEGLARLGDYLEEVRRPTSDVTRQVA